MCNRANNVLCKVPCSCIYFASTLPSTSLTLGTRTITCSCLINDHEIHIKILSSSNMVRNVLFFLCSSTCQKTSCWWPLWTPDGLWMTLHCWNGQKWNPSGSGTMQSKCAQQRRTLTFFWKSDSMAPAMIIFMTEHWRCVENYLTRKKGPKNHIMFSSNELSYILARVVLSQESRPYS